jgi:hypothetical protein
MTKMPLGMTSLMLPDRGKEHTLIYKKDFASVAFIVA